MKPPTSRESTTPAHIADGLVMADLARKFSACPIPAPELAEFKAMAEAPSAAATTDSGGSATFDRALPRFLFPSLVLQFVDDLLRLRLSTVEMVPYTATGCQEAARGGRTVRGAARRLCGGQRFGHPRSAEQPNRDVGARALAALPPRGRTR